MKLNENNENVKDKYEPGVPKSSLQFKNDNVTDDENIIEIADSDEESDDSDDDEEDIDEAEPNHGDLQNGIPIDDDNQPEDFDHMNGNNIENAENGEVIQEIQNGEVNQMVEGLANNNIELIDSQMSNNGNQVAHPQLPVDLSEQNMNNSDNPQQNPPSQQNLSNQQNVHPVHPNANIGTDESFSEQVDEQPQEQIEQQIVPEMGSN